MTDRRWKSTSMTLFGFPVGVFVDDGDPNEWRLVLNREYGGRGRREATMTSSEGDVNSEFERLLRIVDTLAKVARKEGERRMADDFIANTSATAATDLHHAAARVRDVRHTLVTIGNDLRAMAAGELAIESDRLEALGVDCERLAQVLG